MPLSLIQYHRVYFSLPPFLIVSSNSEKPVSHYLQYICTYLFDSSTQLKVVSELLTHTPVGNTFTK